MNRLLLFCCLVVLISFAIGCGEPVVGTPVRPTRPDISVPEAAEKPKGGDHTTDSAVSSKKSAPSIKPVELIEANWNELQSLIHEQKGKIVVVDVWSTACEPCMKEFPHLISLQRQHSEDVVAISFDIDFAGIKNKPPEYYRERVLEFLGSQDESSVLHRMCNTPADELFVELDLDSIPAIYVYGRDGALAKRFDGSSRQGEALSYEKQIIPFVDELIK